MMVALPTTINVDTVLPLYIIAIYQYITYTGCIFCCVNSGTDLKSVPSKLVYMLSGCAETRS